MFAFSKCNFHCSRFYNILERFYKTLNVFFVPNITMVVEGMFLLFNKMLIFLTKELEEKISYCWSSNHFKVIQSELEASKDNSPDNLQGMWIYFGRPLGIENI